MSLWVKITLENTVVPSFTMALQKAKGDEEKGFDLWFKWYDSYVLDETRGQKRIEEESASKHGTMRTVQEDGHQDEDQDG